MEGGVVERMDWNFLWDRGGTGLGTALRYGMGFDHDAPWVATGSHLRLYMIIQR
jgi:hypothetical protein